MKTVKPVAWLLALSLLAGARADVPQQLLERAREFENTLAEWNRRVARGEAEGVLAELGVAELSDEERADARVENLQGVCLLRLGRVAEAVAHFEAAIRSDPSAAEAHRNLAIALEGLGRTGRAMSEFTQALELEPGDLEARLGLASMQWKLRRPDAAAETLAQLRDAEREDPRVLRLTARVADARGDLATARSSWELVDRRAPDAESARRLAELDLPSRREDWLRRCAERDSTALDCSAALAQLLLASGRIDESRTILQRLQERGRLSPESEHNLLLALQAKGESEAIEALVETHPPALAASWGVVALARRAGGQPASALEAVRRARGLAMDDLDLANLEAVLLAETGDRAAARRIWEWILARDPSHADARRNVGG